MKIIRVYGIEYDVDTIKEEDKETFLLGVILNHGNKVARRLKHYWKFRKEETGK